MNKRVVASIMGASVLCVGTLLVAAPSASAASCKPSFFGQDFFGNQRYDCPGGSYTLRQPFGEQSWDDPFASYELRPDSGSSWNKPSQRCRYDRFFNRYNCR